MNTEIQQRIKQNLQKVGQQGNFQGLKQNDVTSVLDAYRGLISQVLPKGISAEKIIGTAAYLVANNRDLAKCNANSVVGAVIQAAMLGLEPISTLGHCYFVPYKGMAQFQIGYQGYIELGRRSGLVKALYAHVVRKGDEFDYHLGTGKRIIHKPVLEGNGKVTHVYAVVKYTNGGYDFVVLTTAQVEIVRQRAPGGNNGPWKTDWEAMAMKTAIRRLRNSIPMSVRDMSAFASDEKVIVAENFNNDGSGLDQFAVDAFNEEIDGLAEVREKDEPVLDPEKPLTDL